MMTPLFLSAALRMRRILLPPGLPAIVLPLLCVSGMLAPCGGQSADRGSGLELELETGGAYMGNFFRVPPGAKEQDVFAATGEIRLALPVLDSGSEVFGGLGGTSYESFRPSLEAFAGGRLNQGVHFLSGTAALRAHTPRMEVGDSMGFADVLMAQVSYRIRPGGGIQLEALANADRQVYGRTRERDNHAYSLGGAIRYLGFGRGFSPELGAGTGNRDVRAAEEDYGERSLWARIRSTPVRSLYMSARYRVRSREYTYRDPSSGQLPRQDDRKDLTLSVQLSLGSQWSWNGYFSFQEASSTKASRNFSTRYLWTGLAYRLR